MVIQIGVLSHIRTSWCERTRARMKLELEAAASDLQTTASR